jgi:macrodomain Ter protein organizer (MatP/YcbG family)
MASPLFRSHDSEFAVWKTGSNEIVRTELLFSQKIAQVLVEADQRAQSFHFHQK